MEYVRSKILKSISIISKIKYFVTEKAMINLYYAFIQSHINYNLINWSGTNTTTLNPIRKAIKKVIRIMTFQNRYQHTETLLSKLEILPFDLQIKHKQALFMWKLTNGYISEPISNLFTKNNHNPNRYNIPYRKNETGKRVLSYVNVITWNMEVHSPLKTISFYNSFNKKYKDHLLLTI